MDTDEARKLIEKIRTINISRRGFLRGTALAAGTAAAGSLLGACGGGEATPAATETAAATATPTAAATETAATETATAAATAAATETAAATAAAGGILNYATHQEPDNIDVNIAAFAGVNRIANQMYDPLVRMIAGDTKLYPGLATRWEVSDDVKEYTLYLRDDVKFHDDTPFNAEAVQFTFDRIADPANKSMAGSAALGPSYDHCEIVDDFAVKVVFKDPYAAFLTEATETFLAPSSPTAIKTYGDEYVFHLTGTGPFMFEEYVKGSHVSMVRNPNYNWAPEFWGRNGPAKLEGIRWAIVPEPGTRTATLDTGEMDIIENILPTDVQRYVDDPNFHVDLVDAPGSPRVFNINVTKPPTDDLKVRQAIMHAINSPAICDALWPGVFEPADCPMEVSMQCYKSYADLYPPDPVKAGQLLDEAGWTMGANGIREKNGEPLHLIFLFPPDNEEDEMVQMAQAQMKEVGIDVEIMQQAFPTIFDSWAKGEIYHFATFFYWWNDPSVLYAEFHSERSPYENFSHYMNPEVDRLIDQGAAIFDMDERCKIYQQAMDIIMGDAICKPIRGKRQIYGMQANVTGLRWTSVTYPMLYDVTKG